jgi:hypothetical protein
MHEITVNFVKTRARRVASKVLQEENSLKASNFICRRTDEKNLTETPAHVNNGQHLLGAKILLWIFRTAAQGHYMYIPPQCQKLIQVACAENVNFRGADDVRGSPSSALWLLALLIMARYRIAKLAHHKVTTHQVDASSSSCATSKRFLNP